MRQDRLPGIVRIYSILVRINIHILQLLSPRPQLLRRGTLLSTVSRTPLVAACDAHTRRSHTHVPRPASRPCRRPRATCALATRTGGEISTNITRGSPHPGHGSARPRAPFTSVKPNIYEYKRTKCDRIDYPVSYAYTAYSCE